ncbi:Scr1 family TA system antitoxin-like transcriptional regulator [Spirillospora sp. NPDC047279]|uniref:Scr1 family TA system antitoxin-like transcriptional regulator n=1 Tax=Spirillospora sp. NPDC047279 TaxID=3155478 RepID=UPI0033F37DA0
MARQAVLSQSQPKPPSYQAITGEAALHQVVGSPDVAHSQLARLTDVAHLEHVSIRVLPYTQGARLWVGNPFHLLLHETPGQLTVAGVEYFNRSKFVEDEVEVTEHEEVYARLVDATLDESKSLELVERIMSAP